MWTIMWTENSQDRWDRLETKEEVMQLLDSLDKNLGVSKGDVWIYDKPYPTIGDLIKGKDYDCISYRIAYPGCDEEHGTFAGYFSAKNGEIIPLDGDIYELNEEVIESEEWTIPEEEIQNGLTIVVIGGLIRK